MVKWPPIYSSDNACCEKHAPPMRSFMIVCPVCHEKRCPRALDCSVACSAAETVEIQPMTTSEKLAEYEAIKAYVEVHHNAYGETGAYCGMKVPSSILEAIKELVDENKALLNLELDQTKQALREAELELAKKNR